MPERRQLKRRHLVYYLRVVNRDTNREVGHVMDVTPEGLLVMSKRRIQVGRRIKLRMVLPDPLASEQTVEFEGKSLWTGKDVNPDFFDTGFKLSRISRRHLATIRTLIKDHGFRD